MNAADIGLLVGREPRLQKQPGEAENAVERGAEFVTDRREQARFRRVRRLGLLPGLALLAFAQLPGGVGKQFDRRGKTAVFPRDAVALGDGAGEFDLADADISESREEDDRGGKDRYEGGDRVDRRQRRKRSETGGAGYQGAGNAGSLPLELSADPAAARHPPSVAARHPLSAAPWSFQTSCATRQA